MDNIKVNSKHVGISFDDYLDSRLTEEEKNYIELKSDFFIDLINLRREKNLTQKDLEALTGIKQSTIAKIERGTINPSMNNVFKLLSAMGKTIKIA